MEHVIYIGLGSNVEPRAETLLRALKLLDGRGDIAVRQVSQLIPTEPVGQPDQPEYLNGAAMLVVTLEADVLLAVLQDVEAELGRNRSREQRWGPRTCDLDMLLFDDLVVESERLTLPHPRMHERLFVLKPLAQIAAAVVHPAIGKTVAELLAALEG